MEGDERPVRCLWRLAQVLAVWGGVAATLHVWGVLPGVGAYHAVVTWVLAACVTGAAVYGQLTAGDRDEDGR